MYGGKLLNLTVINEGSKFTYCTEIEWWINIHLIAQRHRMCVLETLEINFRNTSLQRGDVVNVEYLRLPAHNYSSPSPNLNYKNVVRDLKFLFKELDLHEHKEPELGEPISARPTDQPKSC